ncbi:MAG: nuclear transport factor 2 family protein [Pseudomonadales bacterium]|nr:nuclear transport factor 2 family protein [Pseudomonadales bacterium]
MCDQEINSILKIVTRYFEGLHYGDVEKLQRVFHPDCVLKASGIRRDLMQWFALINDRPIPAQQGDPFNYQVLSLEVLGEQAMVKVFCPLLGANFIDYLGLLKEQGHWLIVNKMYAERPAFH